VQPDTPPVSTTSHEMNMGPLLGDGDFALAAMNFVRDCRLALILVIVECAFSRIRSPALKVQVAGGHLNMDPGRLGPWQVNLLHIVDAPPRRPIHASMAYRERNPEDRHQQNNGQFSSAQEPFVCGFRRRPPPVLIPEPAET